MSDVEADTGVTVKGSSWKKNFSKKRSPEEQKQERKASLETAFEACGFEGDSVSISDLSRYMSVSDKTVRNRIKEHGGFWIDEGKVGRK